MVIDPNRVKELFLSAAEQLDEAARAAYLDRACEGDAELRERVEALLRSHDTADSFLGSPAVQPPEPHEMATQDVGSAATPEEASEAEGDLQFLDKPRRVDSLGRLGHYEMLQVLGRGGFGIVFRAFDDMLQRVVAVKVMAPQIATLSPARKRFVREARSSAAVRHEHVVQVYEVGEQPLPFLVMEFIPGETLQQRLDRTGPLDVPEILRIGRQVAEGLAAAHACDLIHRDIKPGNILLEGGSHKAKITDFGLARAADDASISQSGVIAGTPMFMAPEQALGNKIDQRADLFSLGSVLYQMASGRPPFRAPSALAVLKRVAEETPRPIPEIILETPDWLCSIITKLHAKKPEDRFQSAREVADLLADCEAKLKAKQEVKNVLPAVVRPAAPSASGGRKWAATAAVLLLPVIALAVTEFAGVTYLFRGQQPTPDPTRPGGDAQPVGVAKEEPTTTYKNGIGMEFAIVPKGKSWLGGVKDRLGDKEVEILADFYLGKYEVTQEEWEKVMGENPSHFSRTGDGMDAVKDTTDADLKRFPVENVTWDQCQLFVEKLNKRAKETGWVYRMPTETEWEYACRGGPVGKLDGAFYHYFKKPTNTLLLEQANFSPDNDGKGGLGRTCKVGSYEPNLLGLYDMQGNVWEFCEDAVLRADSLRLGRGGSWFNDSRICRAAGWLKIPPERRVNRVGLRLARIPASDPAPEAKAPVGAAPAEPNVHDTLLKGVVLLPPEQLAAALRAKLKDRNPDFDAAFLKAIPGLPAEQQLAFVKAWLNDRNRAFQEGGGGDIKHKVEGGVVTGLEVPSPFLRDLTAVRGLTGLRSLTARATLGYDNRAEGDAAMLRSLQTLATINGKPAAQFWKDAEAKRAAFKEWLQRVPTLPADQQVAAVFVVMKERNPELGGTPKHKAEGDMVTESVLDPGGGICTVSDLEPVRALAGLKSLSLPHGYGLEDLEPLRGMQFTRLHLSNLSQCIFVRDLEPLRGMPLTDLYLGACEVRTLDPLQGMPLTRLTLQLAQVKDLMPLEGMPLIVLNLHQCEQIEDISPLKGMPLKALTLSYTKVKDLTPLKGMSLIHLNLSGAPVQDLEPIKGMPLKVLSVFRTGVADLKPLQGMELTEITLTPSKINAEDMAILRAMKSLKTFDIGLTVRPGVHKPLTAEEFWQRHDKGEFTK